jgi:branched-chain amino acid transport system substrate-binding protein
MRRRTFIILLGGAATKCSIIIRAPHRTSIASSKARNYLRKHEFKTIMGSWRYGPNGEWTKSGFLEVQYHDIKEGVLETWRGMSYQTVLTPAEFKTGNVIYLYEKAN